MVTAVDDRKEASSFWDLIAQKISASPSSIEIARQNIIRWLAQGQSAPYRLIEWDKLLADAQRDEKGKQVLMRALLRDDEGSQRLRDFHPFAGILSREERRRTKELCGYRH
jgi:hypothetical protein